MKKKKSNRGPKDKKHLFKPGQSGNPQGRPKMPADIRMLIREKSNEYSRKFLYWFDQTPEKVRDCKECPWNPTAMDRMICSAIVQSMNGNYKAFEAILNRILGKPKEHIEHSGGLTLEQLVAGSFREKNE